MGFALLLAVAMVKFSTLFGPSKPNKEKLSTYESGMEPIGSARDRFSVKYYMVAVSFIVFDLEVVFPVSLGNFISELSTKGNGLFINNSSFVYTDFISRADL